MLSVAAGADPCVSVPFPADVAQQFQFAVRVIGSNFAPTVERDEFLVAEKIKKERTYSQPCRGSRVHEECGLSYWKGRLGKVSWNAELSAQWTDTSFWGPVCASWGGLSSLWELERLGLPGQEVCPPCCWTALVSGRPHSRLVVLSL